MAFDPTEVIWLATFTVWDPNALATTTLKLASRSQFTVSGNTPTSQGWVIRLDQPANVSRTAFDDHATQGKGRSAIGDISLNNAYGVLDSYRLYGWDGRSVVIEYLMEGDEYTTDAVPWLDATVESITVGQESIRVALRDWQRALEVPLQTTVYAGDNTPPNGLEGTEDLKGKPKPVCLGAPKNVSPVLVNPQKLIYQVHDGELSGITVRDAGLDLALSPYAFTSIAHGMNSGTTAFVSITDNGSRLVMGGTRAGAACIFTSDDGGDTWTSRGNPFSVGASVAVHGVAWNGSVFVATGDDFLDIATSADGVTWTTRTTTLTAGDACGVVRWAAFCGLFIRCGGNSSGGSFGDVETSPTGTTWTRRAIGATRLYDIAVSDDSIVLVGQQALYTSTNGTSYSSVSYFAGFPDNLFAASYRSVDKAFFIGGLDSNGGAVYTSTDKGAHWTRQVSVFGPGDGAPISAVLGLAVGDSFVVGTGYSGQAMASSVVQSWKVSKFPDSASILRFAYFFENRWLVGGENGSNATLAKNSAAVVYANATDLEDDSLAPPWGGYGVLFDAGGSYVRLGAPPYGAVTCDPIQGASSADRTAGQSLVQVLERAGFTASPNLVTNPSALATGWSTTGTCSASNAALTQYGHTFSRISNLGSGNLYRAVTLTGDTVKLVEALITTDGVDGTGAFALYDFTDSTYLAAAVYTVANGVVTATALVGSRLRVRQVKPGFFLVTLFSHAATAAHANRIYANVGPIVTTLPSVLMSSVRASDAAVEDDWLAFDVTALDAANSAECGYYTTDGDGISCATVAEDFARSVGAWFTTDSYGLVRVGQLTDPSGETPMATLTQDDDMCGMEQVQSADPGAGLPPNRTVVRYGKNYTVQQGAEIVGAVADDDRALFGLEWLDADTDVDTDIQTAHPLSGVRTEESLLTTQADAQDEADRRQALHGVVRYWFDVPVYMSATTIALEIGDVVELQSSRYGMSGGVNARVLGIAPNAGMGRLTLSVWL